MNTYSTNKNESRTLTKEVTQKKSISEATSQFIDNRPEAITQRKLQDMADSSPQSQQTAQLQEIANSVTDEEIIEDQKEQQENKIKELDVSYKDETDNEEHTLYFDYIDGNLTLFRASTPMPFIAYLNKVNRYGNWNGLYSNFEGVKRNYTEIDALLRGYQNYNNESIRKVNSILVTIADVLRRESFFPEKSGDNIKQQRPVSNVQPLGYKSMTAENGEDLDQMTLGIQATPLTIKGNAGSVPGGWNTLGAKLFHIEPRANLRGHLLNHLLHGSGSDWHNIALITEDINTKTEQFLTSPENVAKWEVIGSNHVIDYKVDVKYNRNDAYKGTYENYLPSKLIYTIKRKQLKEGTDGSSIEHWREDALEQPNYQSVYEWDIPYSLDKATIVPNGKLDNRKFLLNKVKDLKSKIGNHPKLQNLEGRISSLVLNKQVGAFTDEQLKISNELKGIENYMDHLIDIEIGKKWTESFLKDWKEEQFRNIGLEIDGDEDINKQLSHLYELLDETPLKGDYSNDGLLYEAKTRIKLYLKEDNFPFWVLDEILNVASKAISGLGERIALEKESRTSQYDEYSGF